MKEYLLERNGKYELHKGGIVPDGAIEVPEGAEIAVKTETAGNIFFWKDLEFHRVPGDHWINLGEGVEWYKNSVPCTVIWQRTQSLNDKYAEIEQVRQSQWSKQVGGNHYKDMPIQPAKFALENKLDYCQANAIKYICRHEHKNGKEDLEKAKHYIDLLIEHHYG